MQQAPLPGIRPCPECGGQRELLRDIGIAEIIAYSSEGARAWDAKRNGGNFTHYMLRCTRCGYIAFFMADTPPKAP